MMELRNKAKIRTEMIYNEDRQHYRYGTILIWLMYNMKIHKLSKYANKCYKLE